PDTVVGWTHRTSAVTGAERPLRRLTTIKERWRVAASRQRRRVFNNRCLTGKRTFRTRGGMGDSSRPRGRSSGTLVHREFPFCMRHTPTLAADSRTVIYTACWVENQDQLTWTTGAR